MLMSQLRAGKSQLRLLPLGREGDCAPRAGADPGCHPEGSALEGEGMEVCTPPPPPYYPVYLFIQLFICILYDKSVFGNAARC